MILLLFIAPFLTTSTLRLEDPVDKARQFTRGIEYDYVTWTARAAFIKIGQAQISPTQFLSHDQQHAMVLRYFDLTKKLEDIRTRIQVIYSDPTIKNPESTATNELQQQAELESDLTGLAPVVESFLQNQVSEVLDSLGIDFIGQPIPPLLFHTSPLPKALIVSPRDKIEEDVNISLLSDLSLEKINSLETNVESDLNMSALVVDVGGIGVYPTMVQQSSDLRWVLDTIAHEWTHNYLTLHPLGMNYDTSPELRTMNETVASIVGGEISQEVLHRYYPDLLGFVPSSSKQSVLAAPRMVFDFRAEMHATRVHVDALLAEGKIQEAETYMEERRVIFIQNGYMIRKLNQAYFAFYGAYADQPGGAAGEDPVGPAVRELRAKSPTLRSFLKQMSRMNSFTDLQSVLQ